MSAREWLPDGALPGRALSAALEEAVERWSKAWFADRPLALRRIDSAAPAPCGGGTLARRALAAGAQDQAGTPADTALLAALERRILADLEETALGAVTGRRPASAEAVLSVQVGDSDGDLASVAISREAAIRFRKGAMPAPRKRPQVAQRRRALGSVRVAVEARLGSAEVALAELRSLAPGDVIVLDRALSEPAELKVRGRLLARATVDEAEDGMTLTIEG
jgi:flagellar motor switch/type III secretory pathway protein FliN